MVPPERIEFLSAVLLTSRQPDRLAGFYRDVLGARCMRSNTTPSRRTRVANSATCTSLVAAITDPDSNEVELTQIGQSWVDHLAEHRRGSADVISRATTWEDGTAAVRGPVTAAAAVRLGTVAR